MAAKVKKFRGLMEKPARVPFYKTNIPAQQAKPAPPLGPQLGKRGINIPSFCRDFNERTKHIKAGVPVPTSIYINPDRSFVLRLNHPPTSYLIKQAAGITKAAASHHNEIAGKITRKHAYEIAALKSQDVELQTLPMQKIVELVVQQARAMGVLVVDQLDAEDYAQFLKNRADELQRMKEERAELKKAKMSKI